MQNNLFAFSLALLVAGARWSSAAAEAPAVSIVTDHLPGPTTCFAGAAALLLAGSRLWRKRA